MNSNPSFPIIRDVMEQRSASQKCLSTPYDGDGGSSEKSEIYFKVNNHLLCNTINTLGAHLYVLDGRNKQRDRVIRWKERFKRM